ncbi:hypothetical protein ACVWVY_000820 [Bradyrhizobium sp. URHC0002]
MVPLGAGVREEPKMFGCAVVNEAAHPKDAPTENGLSAAGAEAVIPIAFDHGGMRPEAMN